MTATLLKTPLNNIHQALGARMVEFAGWNMPIQYSGVMEEHETVRNHAGLFDLTHMAEFEVKGAGAERFLQEMTSNDISKLKVGQAQYNCLCREDGGILDDLLVYRWDDHYWIVANASNRTKVWNWLTEHAKGREVLLGDLTFHTALIALQGPQAERILAPLVGEQNLAEIDFYTAVKGTVLGRPAIISRTGYTGEDGFELYLDYSFAEEVWNGLLAADEGLKPIGLGARDTLRLESGFALYGNELNESRTPYDVSLAWVTRTETEPPPLVAGGLRAAKEKATTCLVGLEMEGRNVPRAGYPVHFEGRQVGEVSSGSFSPSLKKGVALAIVERAARAAGTDVEILVRGKAQPAKVVPLPFVRGSVKRHS
jgi:aminomethyltransferase